MMKLGQQLDTVIISCYVLSVIAVAIYNSPVQKVYVSSYGPNMTFLSFITCYSNKTPHVNNTTVEPASVGVMKRRLPDVILAGCEKCGSGALFFFLTFHPDVKPVEQEIHFFDKDENYQKGLNWYKTIFPPRSQHQIGIDRSPTYWYNENVPRRIHYMDSSTKIIVIVCEPVKKAILQKPQVHFKEGTNVQTLEERVINHVTGEVDASALGVKEGMYYMHLQKWMKWFPLKQIHFVDGERLLIDPVSELQKLEAFLNITHYFNNNLIFFDSDKRHFCVNKNSTKTNRCLEDKDITHPNVDPSLKQKLANFFKPLNERFMRTIGQRFNWNVWN